MSDPSDILHATTVVIEDRGLLILGASGSGKSGLAVALIALGATLVSDDQTRVTASKGALWATPPETIVGRIEVRGIGILNAPNSTDTKLAACVDLDILETERMPPDRTRTVLGVPLPCVHRSETPYFPAALVHYLRYGKAS